jgi:hypothetical protein
VVFNYLLSKSGVSDEAAVNFSNLLNFISTLIFTRFFLGTISDVILGMLMSYGVDMNINK